MKTNKKIAILIGFLCVAIALFMTVKIIYIDKPTALKAISDIDLTKENYEGEHILLPLKDDVKLLSHGYDFQLDKQEKIEKINATDDIFQFTLHKNDAVVGDLEIVVREIDNEDQYVFSRFERRTDQDAKVQLALLFENEKTYDFYQFEEEIEQEHDRVFGIDHTSNVKGVYTIGEQRQLFLAQNYISNELTTTYDNGKESVLRELVNEDKNIAINEQDNHLIYSMELRTTANGQISENWFLLSDTELFSSTSAMKSYKDRTNHEFISSRKWLTATGPYTKLPWSIEPSTTLGYGRNLVVLQGMPFVKTYKLTPERFYYDMIVNSANYIWDFKSDSDLWETEYTSTWLENDYGIIAPYTDTRHNENIALFLSAAGDILNNQMLKDSYLLYADFLANQETIDNILRTTQGYYILDYYSEAQTKKTHVSLNHALGEMNYLFNIYEETNDDKYLQVALKIKAATEDIGDDWINPTNGDLWYQINGDRSFEGKDYDTLTLEDLVVSLDYFERFDLPYDDVFMRLVDTKVNYIIDNDVEMKLSLYEQLLLLGFEKQVKDYPHVIGF